MLNIASINAMYKYICMSKFLNGGARMAKCDICDKDMNFGRKITMTRSQISRRGLRQQKANVKRVRVMVDGTPRKMNVCTRCLRSDKVERA